jgi:hypothetical protein
LLLTAGQLADLAVARSSMRTMASASRAAFRSAAGRAIPGNLLVAAHQGHLLNGDRKIPVHRTALRYVGDLALGRPGVPAIDPDAADIGFDETEDRLDKGRFAGTVRADHPDQLIAFNTHADIEQGRPSLVADRQVVDLDNVALLSGHRYLPWPSRMR